jgi:hypothetical protein
MRRARSAVRWLRKGATHPGVCFDLASNGGAPFIKSLLTRVRNVGGNVDDYVLGKMDASSTSCNCSVPHGPFAHVHAARHWERVHPALAWNPVFQLWSK